MNAGVTIIGFLLIVGALITGYWNSFLIMTMIGASQFMWVLWGSSIFGTILGTVLMKLGAD